VLRGDELQIERRVELALCVLKPFVGADHVVDRLVAHGQAEMAHLEIGKLAVDEPLQRGVDDAELLQLLIVERGAVQRLAPALGILLHRLIERADVYLAVAHRGHDRLGPAVAEDVADAPDAEGDDQHAEQDLDEDGRGSGADRLQHDRQGIVRPRRKGARIRRMIGAPRRPPQGRLARRWRLC
jgi:hypothetical protein